MNPVQMQKGCRISAGLAFLGFLTGFCMPDGLAATLQFSQPQREGDYWAVPVSLVLGAGETVASLQFDVGGGTMGIDDVAGGAAAAEAGKDTVAGFHEEGVSVLVAGFNQDAIRGGAVAWIYVPHSGQGAQSVIESLALSNVVLSDPSGGAVLHEAPVADEREAEEGDDGETDGGAGGKNVDGDESEVDALADGLGGPGSGIGGFANPGGGGAGEGEEDGQGISGGTRSARRGPGYGARPSRGNFSGGVYGGSARGGQAFVVAQGGGAARSVNQYSGKTHEGVEIPGDVAGTPPEVRPVGVGAAVAAHESGLSGAALMRAPLQAADGSIDVRSTSIGEVSRRASFFGGLMVLAGFFVAVLLIRRKNFST